ncbi:TAP transporter inhibitor ICP47 [Chimpanzee herpesvirus strain 105640]|uniref:ICP47 protein n=1 Tax=Chimpanzee herpesvirus strain 105640 TaxID=332937 RepID=K9MG74_9ALPH|nr:TAP transporter inhibitor ICP47 [Chimpanzee herpesvirus strain 105640]AFV26962.1 TAP transporter inhibitor ICP47 [Chimpanzee herpesvirus strain 105640]
MSWALKTTDRFLDLSRGTHLTYGDVCAEIHKREREDREAARTAVNDPELPLLRPPVVRSDPAIRNPTQQTCGCTTSNTRQGRLLALDTIPSVVGCPLPPPNQRASA